jgi:hypothetical protein
MARQRFIVTIILSSLLLLSVGFVRPPEGEGNTGLYREAFWRKKMNWSAQFDVVLAGDSRVLCDFSPASMGEVLTSHRIANFAFNYVGLTPEYLRAVESKLDSASHYKIIVLGITPRALTPLNERVSGYLEEKNRSLDEVVVASYLAPLVSFFRPISIVSMKKSLLRQEQGYKDFYPDGWMSVKLLPPNPKADLGVYQRIFINNRVSPNTIDELLKIVREWRQKGIKVYAFRPPAAAEIVEVENTQSGFDESAFARRFTQAGGSWVTVDTSSYEICDGSHLSADSARRFSRVFASSLK